MDRQIVYPGSLPRDIDILKPQVNVMKAIGFALNAAFGTSTLADGLACAQTSVPSLSVTVAPGSILTNLVVDTLDFGSLSADSSHGLVKMGINLSPTTIGPFTPPATAGQSQNFLIQAQMSETDITPIVLPYYNASNPAQAYSGPSNTSIAQNTVRQQTVLLQLKAGTAATTGSQATPTPDAGFVGLWVLMIANGATTIVNANISEYPLAPFLRTKIPQMRRRLSANLDLYVSSSGNDSNSGFSVGGAFATRGAAWRYVVSGVDLNGYNVLIHVADGTYTDQGVFSGALVGATNGTASVQFIGNTSAPANCFINVTSGSCFFATLGAQFSVAGFKCAASGTAVGQGHGIVAYAGGSSIAVANCELASCAVSDISASGNAVIVGNGPLTLSGTSGRAMFADTGGLLSIASTTITLASVPAYATSFANCSNGSVIAIQSITFTGTATGAKYVISNNGIVDTATGNINYLPGSSAGVTSSGGQYS